MYPDQNEVIGRRQKKQAGIIIWFSYGRPRTPRFVNVGEFG
jgi:hypothetical protein